MNNYKVYQINISSVSDMPKYAFKGWNDAKETFALSDYFEAKSESTDDSEENTLNRLLAESVKVSDVVRFNENFYYCDGDRFIKLIAE